MVTAEQAMPELSDPFDAFDEDGGVAVDPLTLAPVQKLLRGEWDVKEAFELVQDDCTGGVVTRARYIAVRASTWMMNPNAQRSDYVLNFAKTPRRALRDFACWPTAVEEPWLRDPTVLGRAFKQSLVSPFEDAEEGGVFSKDFVPDDDCSYFIHIDIGLRRDAAGLSMAHWCEKRDRCVVDLAMSFQAPETENLDFRKLRLVVYELVGLGFNVAECTLDKWNSADTIAEFTRHDLEAREISDAEQVDSYDGLLELLIFNKIDLYPHELLEKELRQLQWKNQRLDHPESGSKDIADAVAVVSQQSRRYGSNLVAFSSSKLDMSRTDAVIGSSEQRDRLIDGESDGGRSMMGAM